MIKNNVAMLMNAKKMKMAELQKLTGLSESTVRRVFYGTTNTISFNTMDKICWALNCTVNDIFEYIED